MARMFAAVNRAIGEIRRRERTPVAESTEDDRVGMKASTEFDELGHLKKIIRLHDTADEQTSNRVFFAKFRDEFEPLEQSFETPTATIQRVRFTTGSVDRNFDRVNKTMGFVQIFPAIGGKQKTVRVQHDPQVRMPFVIDRREDSPVRTAGEGIAIAGKLQTSNMRQGLNDFIRHFFGAKTCGSSGSIDDWFTPARGAREIAGEVKGSDNLRGAFGSFARADFF